VIFATSVCHKDARQAIHQWAWIKQLGGLPKRARVVVTTSPKVNASAVLKSEIEAAAKEFLGAAVTPVEVSERGWPWSATAMFLATLRSAGDACLYVEPDAIPMKEGWFEALWEEYLSCGKPFMGARVGSKFGLPIHMTGNAFYPKDWETLAPKLSRPVGKPSGAWDIDAADQVVPQAHFTEQILQHWREGVPNFSVVKLEDAINSKVQLYHQSKDGKLIESLGGPKRPYKLRQPAQIELNLNSPGIREKVYGFKVISEADLGGGRTGTYEIDTWDQLESVIK